MDVIFLFDQYQYLYKESFHEPLLAQSKHTLTTNLKVVSPSPTVGKSFFIL